MSVFVLNDTQYIYSISYTADQISIQKTTESGSLIWTYSQQNTDDKQSLTGALDMSSNVIVSYTKITGSASQIVVFKVSNTDTPTLLWSVSGFTASNSDSKSSVASGPNMEVVVTFQTNGTVTGGTKTGSTDVAVVKLNGSTGSTIWSVQNGVLNVSKQMNRTPDVSVGPNGVIYVAYVTSEGTEIVEEITADGTVLGPTFGNPCFLAKTPVLTRYGYRPIETLQKGDELVSNGGRLCKVVRLLKKRVIPSELSNPYVIPEGMFGAKQRIYISPNHKVFVPERGMVYARDLGLRQWIMREPFVYYNVELEEWKPMVVAGVEVESMAPFKTVRVSLARFIRLISLAPEEKRRTILRSSRLIGNQVSVSFLKSKWTKN